MGIRDVNSHPHLPAPACPYLPPAWTLQPVKMRCWKSEIPAWIPEYRVELATGAV